MAPMTNLLASSRSPMERLRSSDQSQLLDPSSPNFLDHYFAMRKQKQKELYKEDAASMANFIDPQAQSQTQIPRLANFLGGGSSSSSIVRYSDNSQTQRQNSSSLTIYDHPRHHNQTGFYSDHNHNFGFQNNSGSAVDESGSIRRTQFAGDYLGHVVESSVPALRFHVGSSSSTGRALSLGVNINNGKRINNNIINEIETTNSDQNSSDSSNKKTGETSGQRTSIYRGVTRHRWTGRYEAHLWDNSCRREGQARKGRQVYLGGYDNEENAAKAYDLAALKYWNSAATLNFPITNYSVEIEEMKHMTKYEFIASLRRRSTGFSRGVSMYRGVTRHHQHGRWQARIGRVSGNKDLYLGTYATEVEAAEAYDVAAIKFRGLSAVTNFEMKRYDVKSIMKSALPIGSAAKRHRISTEASSSEQRPILSSMNFPLHPNSNIQSQPRIPYGIPSPDVAALYHHHQQRQQQQQQQQNFFQHFQTNAASSSTGSNNNFNVQGSMGHMAPNASQFFLWPNQSYYRMS